MLHDASETVAVGSNQHPLSLFDLGNDLLIPEGQRPGDGVFQTLTAGELVLGQVGITAVLQRKSLCNQCGARTNITALSAVGEASPCLWSGRRHAPHPWAGEECQKSVSRS